MAHKSGVTVKDVPSHEFVVTYAQHLKRSGKLHVPKWVDLVKTGHFKEMPPNNPDWYYVRAASMARKIYLRGGLGVGAFRKIYGGNKDRGVAPSHFAKSSGAVARSVLRELERIKVIEKDPKGGRRVTSTGQRDLDRIAGQIKVVVKNL